MKHIKRPYNMTLEALRGFKKILDDHPELSIYACSVKASNKYGYAFQTFLKHYAKAKEEGRVIEREIAISGSMLREGTWGKPKKQFTRR